MSKVLYFGRWGAPGHFLFEETGHTSRHPLPEALRSLDGNFAGDPAKVKYWLDGIYGKKTVPHWDEKDQEQGLARLWTIEGWTLISFWDRSADQRGGSNSTFLAEGMHSFEEMVALAARHFPTIWKRITSAFEVRPA